jgi:hypothetical protein
MKTIRIAVADWLEIRFDIPVVAAIPQVERESVSREHQEEQRQTIFPSRRFARFAICPTGIDPPGGARSLHCRHVRQLAARRDTAQFAP